MIVFLYKTSDIPGSYTAFEEELLDLSIAVELRTAVGKEGESGERDDGSLLGSFTKCDFAKYVLAHCIYIVLLYIQLLHPTPKS